MDSLVSILIPSFNAEAWIADSIKSALSQSWRHIEVVVVDDGSTDQTFAIAQRFASANVNVVRQKNQGPAAARNHAFTLCQGEYIQWLDADDLLSPDKIAQQMEVAQQEQNPRSLLSCGWGYFAYRANRAKFSPTSLWCDLSPVEWLLRKMSENLHMQTATWLVSRELTEAAGPWDTRLSNDGDGEYFCRVILASDGIRFVPQAQVFYRISPPSRVSYIGRSNEKKEARLLSMKLHLKYIQSLERSERVRVACLTYLQNWLSIFYPERPDLVLEVEKMAASLGGHLEAPLLRWKYAWIKSLFGWGPAKRAELVLPEVKSYMIRSWDRVMYRLAETAERRRLQHGPREKIQGRETSLNEIKR